MQEIATLCEQKAIVHILSRFLNDSQPDQYINGPGRLRFNRLILLIRLITAPHPNNSSYGLDYEQSGLISSQSVPFNNSIRHILYELINLIFIRTRNDGSERRKDLSARLYLSSLLWGQAYQCSIHQHSSAVGLTIVSCKLNRAPSHPYLLPSPFFLSHLPQSRQTRALVQQGEEPPL